MEGERVSDKAKAWYEGSLKQIAERIAQTPNEEEKHIWKMLEVVMKEIDPSDPNLTLSIIKRFAGFILDLELEERADISYLKDFFIKVCANNL